TSQVYISSADKVTHERIQPTILHREELGRGAGCDADARYEKSYPASPGVAKWTPVGRHRWRKDSSLQTPAWECGWFQRHPGGPGSSTPEGFGDRIFAGSCGSTLAARLRPTGVRGKDVRWSWHQRSRPKPRCAPLAGFRRHASRRDIPNHRRVHGASARSPEFGARE